MQVSSFLRKERDAQFVQESVRELSVTIKQLQQQQQAADDRKRKETRSESESARLMRRRRSGDR
jgi:hypothetical protein